jgi:hypothetical protein
VENSVSKILTEKEMVYHQRLEEMENRLRGFMAGIGSCSALWAATPVSNLATSDSSSFASDHFLSVRSRMSVASYQTEAEMTSSEVESVEASVGEPDGLSKELGADEASKTSGSGFEHIKAYVGNEYAAEWSCNLEKADNLSEAYSSIAMTSSEAECGGVELMMEREGVVDGEEEHTAIMSGHHSFLKEIQRRLEQMMQMEPLVNGEDDCSWSECEHQQDGPQPGQPRLEQLAVRQVWTKPKHQNQQPEQVEQELSYRPLPNWRLHQTTQLPLHPVLRSGVGWRQ